MGTSWTQWCNYCHGYRSAWTSDHRRCWSCDNWTMTCHNHGCCDHGVSESLRRAEDRNSSLISQNSSLQSQLSSKSTEVAEKDKQIAIVNNDLTTTKNQLTETKGELTAARGQVKELGDLFNNLKIESNNKDKEIEIRAKILKI